MRKLLWSILLITLSASIVLGLRYLFRTEIDDNPALGEFTYGYIWGKPRSITLDRDRDGRIDVKALIDGPFGSYASHTASLLEFWESSMLDGFLDRHAVMRDGEINMLEIDSDRDGTFELRLDGDEARKFFNEIAEKRDSGEE